MSLDRATDMVSRGQTLARRLMTLTLSAYSPDGAITSGTGMATAQRKLEGECRGKVQASSMQGDVKARTVTIGGTTFPIIEGGLHIPLEEFLDDQGLRIRPGWQFDVDVVGAPADPALRGRTYQVVEVPAKSFATARRLNVFEVRKVGGT